MTPDDFKSLVETLSKVIDVKAKTTEIVLKAHVSAEIKASEERTEAKADHLQLVGKVDRIAKSYVQRLETLEEQIQIVPTPKNTDSPLPCQKA